MKHTPGEWKAYKRDGGGYAIHGAMGGLNENVIATVRGTTVSRTMVQMDEEEKGNATLIAASPDLLSALKGILDQACENGCPEFESAKTREITKKHTPQCIAARAAITRAESK